MKNLGLRSFVRFIAKYGDEAQAVANALRVLSHPFLERSEREAVNNVIEKMESAARNIASAIPDLEKASAIRINKNDIKDAVQELLPAIVAQVVREQASQAEQKND